MFFFFFFFQAEDGIRDLVRSRGLGDVYKRQIIHYTDDGSEPSLHSPLYKGRIPVGQSTVIKAALFDGQFKSCLLYTSDAADERSSVDLGGRRIIKKKKKEQESDIHIIKTLYKTKNRHIEQQNENRTNTIQ